MNEEKQRIATLNDTFRRSGIFNLTRGIIALNDMPGLLEAIKSYKEFNPDNDPYSEHDFGSLVWMGEKVFWKIDYYDIDRRRWQDPLFPNCERVLTVMLASEY